MQKPTAIDLFAGAGGITQALKEAGFEVKAAVEIEPIFAQSYRLNHCNRECGKKDHLIQKDIRKITPKDLEPLIGDIPVGELDLLAGCPPCQGFSRQMIFKRKNKNEKDIENIKRNSLVFSYLKFVRLLRPKYIFLENVPGLQDHNNIWPRVKVLLQSGEKNFPRYKIKFDKINAADLGVPQRRYRFVLVGKRLDLCNNSSIDDNAEVPFPKLNYKDNPVTLRQYFSNFQLPKPVPLQEAPPNELHKYSSLGELNLLRLKNTPEGGGRKDWPEFGEINGKKIRLWLKCHDKNNSGYRDVYGRMKWDDVAPTLTGGCLNISKGRFAHPTENRPITAREAALIQTFPIDYKFVGNWTEIALQIGNAVPVLMGKAFFDEIKKDLEQIRLSAILS